MLRIYSNPKILKLKLGCCCCHHTINQPCFFNEKVTPARLYVNNSPSCLILYSHGLIVRITTRYHRFGNFIIIFGLGGCCSRKSCKVGPPLWKLLNHIVVILLYAFSLTQNFSQIFYAPKARTIPSPHLSLKYCHIFHFLIGKDLLQPWLQQFLHNDDVSSC